MRRWPVVAALALAAAGCSGEPPRAQFLVFGDAGYHYAYPPTDEPPPAESEEAYIQAEQRQWLGRKRPPNEFRPRPAHELPRSRGWVEASGREAVADAMYAYCRTGPRCGFALMLGDNLYPDGATAGADGRDDTERFRRILYLPFARFAHIAPGFRIYSALGNHDWHTSREGAMAQLNMLETIRPFYMNGVRYKVAPTGNPRDLEVFVIDTHVLLSGVTVLEDELDDDGSEMDTEEVDPPSPWSRPHTREERGMVQWLERSLARSRARWKIVAGHHPLWSSAGTKFQQARALRSLLLPMLCRYADMYVAGHEHTLELHTDSCADKPEASGKPPLAQLVSGAASKQRPVNSAFATHQLLENPEVTSIWAEGLIWGFVHVTLGTNEATIRMVSTPDDGSGVPVVEFEHRFQRRSGPGS